MLRYVMALRVLRCDERGVTALEYGLIAALIALGIIGAVTTLGSNLGTTYSHIAANFNNIGR